MWGGAWFALLAAFSVAFTTPAAASPPLPASPAITPGAGIATYSGASDDTETCTAGWLAHTRDGHPVMFTAGHCTHGGLQVSMKWTATNHYEKIGTFVQSVDQGNVGDDADFGVVALDSQIPRDARVLDRRPIDGTTAAVNEGDELCKYGVTTGRTCGHVLAAPTASKVRFDAPSDSGDSGGPVYLIRPNGDAVAVGITIRGNQDHTIAELVTPWLDKFGLTLDVTPGGTTEGVRYGH